MIGFFKEIKFVSIQEFCIDTTLAYGNDFFHWSKFAATWFKQSVAFSKEFAFRPIVYIDVYGLSGKSNQKKS